jgi:alpha-mannosidase
VNASTRHLVVVPHTHWDREWYLTHEQFRFRLLHLLDGLLDLLESDPSFRHFLLDGQTIVLDDYLAVRPAARERIEKLVRAGRLLIGPWTVLPDEWLVSGEALIRNLRNGLETAERFGGGMRLGYVPDQFGHVGQLPQIFRGFGFEGAALWRGVPNEVAETTFWWEAPDGSRVFTLYLPRGYGNAALLPLDPAGLARRLAREIGALAPFTRGETMLLMNGSDHLEPQPRLPAALETAAPHIEGVSVEIGTLPEALRRFRAEAEGRSDVPVHRGELRSGLRAPLLPGCASARMPQKQRDFRNDRLLTRYLEPLATWLGALGGDPDRALLDFVWRIALENHPHDSICGCSVDRVHEQMDARFQRVEELADAHLASVLRRLAPHVALPDAAAAAPGLVVWNPHAAVRAQVESEVELDLPGEPATPGACVPLTLVDAQGRTIPAHAEILAPGLVWGGTFATSLAASILPEIGREILGTFVNEIRWRLEGERLVVSARLGGRPEGDLDVPALRSELAAALTQEGVEQVAVEARRPPRVRLRFVDDLPGHGLRVYGVDARPRRAARSPMLRATRRPGGGVSIENGLLRVDASADGTISLARAGDGLLVEDALRIVSEGDRGDEYNFDPVHGDVPVERPARARVRLLPRTGAEVALAVEGRWRVPAALADDRHARATRVVELPARIVVRLAAGLERVDVRVEVDNTAQDHRLRLHVRAPFAARRFEVESAFEIAERPIAPGPDDFGSPRPAERPIGAVPQRGFATIHGEVRGGTLALTVANRGTAEVEAVREADGTTSLALTLLRAVGWLSGTNLSVRPLPAGPPFPAPGAQVPGPHVADFAIRFHEPDDARRVADAHAFQAPPLLFVGGSPRGTLRDGARLLELDDPSVAVSAIEPQRDGGALVRMWNASDRARDVALRWRGPRPAPIEAVDLSGRAASDAVLRRAEDGAFLLSLPPWRIQTLRVG